MRPCRRSPATSEDDALDGLQGALAVIVLPVERGEHGGYAVERGDGCGYASTPGIVGAEIRPATTAQVAGGDPASHSKIRRS